jgi:hypothetical protein
VRSLKIQPSPRIALHRPQPSHAIAGAITNMASSLSHQCQLKLLRREYLQLVEIEHIRWPDGALLKTADAQAWIYEKLIDRDKLQSPPPERYQVRFLKKLVGMIEIAIEDPEEEVGTLTPFSFCIISRHTQSRHIYTQARFPSIICTY